MKKISPLNLVALGFLSSCLLTLPNAVQAIDPPANTSLSQPKSGLTEANVLKAMEKITEAEKKEDINTLLSFLVPYGVTEITVESQGNSVTRNIEGIEAHRTMLENTYQRVKNREVLNERQTIRFTPDGQLAIVTRTTIKNVVGEDGKQFISGGIDTLRFAWIDNQPKLVSIKSQGWLEERPQTSKK
ncbi:MAG: hypothetical protein VKJ02_10025 [Snowella sp.]|nr:hypothetical protein [Snowella sp.]